MQILRPKNSWHLEIPRKIRQSWILLLLISLILAGIIIGKYHYSQPRFPPAEEKSIYQLKEIIVDRGKGTIKFPAQVRKNQGWVQFLLYAPGYKWLESESAIVSPVNLKELQMAIALVDWKIWDALWNGKITPESQNLSLYIEWQENEKTYCLPWEKLIMVSPEEFPLRINDYIFLGSPLFDEIVLESSISRSCQSCPYFPLEEKILRKEFQRKSGKSGYRLNTSHFPLVNQEVTITIEIKK